MPIPLGVLAVAGAGAGPVVAGNAYEHLETQILTGTQATVSFSNLNSTYGSTYQHLQIRMLLRTNRASQPQDTGIFTFNSNTSGYANHFLYGYNGSVTSAASVSQARIEFAISIAGSTNTANLFSGHIMDILDPFETTKNTTVRTLGGAAGAGATLAITELQSGFWNNTAAITSITFDAIGDFIAGSRFSLYGMRSS
jgi:hypothetical protein